MPVEVFEVRRVEVEERAKVSWGGVREYLM